jgi:hypothetical protein
MNKSLFLIESNNAIAIQGVQKFRNFAKLKLIETPQTPISLKSSIHEVSEYT